MSTNTDTAKLGCRENWWGRDDPAAGHSGHAELPGVNKPWYMAKTILLSHPEAEVYCPTCFNERDAAVVLDDPEEYVPETHTLIDEEGEPVDPWDPANRRPDTNTIVKRMYSDRRRHRVCPSCGYVSWGGVLAEMDMATFIDTVRHFLHVVDVQLDVEEIVGDAQSRKSRDVPDIENMRRVVNEYLQRDAE